jgi:5'(3')-deoxyribonucleotidase
MFIAINMGLQNFAVSANHYTRLEPKHEWLKGPKPYTCTSAAMFCYISTHARSLGTQGKGKPV